MTFWFSLKFAFGNPRKLNFCHPRNLIPQKSIKLAQPQNLIPWKWKKSRLPKTAKVSDNKVKWSQTNITWYQFELLDHETDRLVLISQSSHHILAQACLPSLGPGQGYNAVYMNHRNHDHRLYNGASSQLLQNRVRISYSPANRKKTLTIYFIVWKLDIIVLKDTISLTNPVY